MKPCRFLVSVILVLWLFPAFVWARDFSRIGPMLGENDAVAVADGAGRVIYARNAQKSLVPASTLKLLTALAAIHYLGQDYRFKTAFFLRSGGVRSAGSADVLPDLVVKGYGDPMLVSEILAAIATKLASEIKDYGDLVLDDTYFTRSLAIPGVTSTDNPYDAPNGALCVNFNTVTFKRLASGAYVSAEGQTPLLAFAMPRIKASGLKAGRIIFPASHDAHLIYAGRLLAYFLEKEGLHRHGAIRRGIKKADSDGLLLDFSSPYTLEAILVHLMAYSNNFIANQLMITMGARQYGPPGTLPKGVKALKAFADHQLGLLSLELVEGSGISRQNRISARQMLEVVNRFVPYHRLLVKDGNHYFKTGTLSGISTRVGYFKQADGSLYRYVVFTNTPGKNAARIVHALRRALVP